MTHKTFYFKREISSLICLIFILLSGKLILSQKEAILSFLFSATGLICLCFTVAAFNLALGIKIYYRIQVIKYHEKDTHIRLFKD